MRKAIDWVKKQNEAGRYVRIGAALSWMLQMYRFHPRERFFNATRLWWNVRRGSWSKMPLNAGFLQRIFYVCISTAPDGSILVQKVPRGNNSYSCNFVFSLRSSERYDHYKRLLLELSSNPSLRRHVPAIIEVRRDGGYACEYVDGTNLAQLREDVFVHENAVAALEAGLEEAVRDLLNDLKMYKQENGAVVGDWALHNLIFASKTKAIVNVDAEGFYSFTGSNIEANLDVLESHLNDLVTCLTLAASRAEDDQRTLAVLRVLDEVRRSGRAYSGHMFLVGYHSLQLGNYYLRGQRECKTRLSEVPFDFAQKVVVDLGCNSGGMLHALAPSIDTGFGFDFNPKCINAARSIQALNGSNNLHFLNFDLDKDDLTVIPALCLNRRVDICFLLSVCMWIDRWREVIHAAARLADAMLFETNGSAQQQREQVAELRRCYGTVRELAESSPDDLLQGARKLLLCSGSRATENVASLPASEVASVADANAA